MNVDDVWLVTKNRQPCLLVVGEGALELAQVRTQIIARRGHEGEMRWVPYGSNGHRLQTKSKTTGGWKWSTYAVEKPPVVVAGEEGDAHGP